MRHDLGHARTVALAFAFSFLIAIMLAGCASKPPANDYLPVQYSGLTSCVSQSAIDNRQ